MVAVAASTATGQNAKSWGTGEATFRTLTKTAGLPGACSSPYVLPRTGGRSAVIPFIYTDNSTDTLLTTLLDVLFQNKSNQGAPLEAVELAGLFLNAHSPRLPFDAVTLLSVTAKSHGTPNGVTLFRPSADPGILQSVVTRRVNGVASWPSPLAPAGANLRPFIQLDGRASRDPNRVLHPLTYSWSVLAGGPAGTLVNPQSPAPTFLPSDPNAVGVCRFALTVSNGVLQSPTAEAEIDLNVAARAPTAIPFAQTPLGDQRTGVGLAPLVVAAGTAVNLDASASTSPATAVRGGLAYAWSQTGGPSLGSPITSSAHATIVPTTAGAYTVQLVGIPSGLTASFDAESLRAQLSSGFAARTVSGPSRRGLEVYVPLPLSGASQPPFAVTTGAGYLVNTPGATLDLRGR